MYNIASMDLQLYMPLYVGGPCHNIASKTPTPNTICPLNSAYLRKSKNKNFLRSCP